MRVDDTLFGMDSDKFGFDDDGQGFVVVRSGSTKGPWMVERSTPEQYAQSEAHIVAVTKEKQTAIKVAKHLNESERQDRELPDNY